MRSAEEQIVGIVMEDEAGSRSRIASAPRDQRRDLFPVPIEVSRLEQDTHDLYDLRHRIPPIRGVYGPLRCKLVDLCQACAYSHRLAVI